jgi:hypothetical protein
MFLRAENPVYRKAVNMNTSRSSGRSEMVIRARQKVIDTLGGICKKCARPTCNICFGVSANSDEYCSRECLGHRFAGLVKKQKNMDDQSRVKYLDTAHAVHLSTWSFKGMPGCRGDVQRALLNGTLKL